MSPFPFQPMFAWHGRGQVPRRAANICPARESAEPDRSLWEPSAIRRPRTRHHPAAVGALPLHPEFREGGAGPTGRSPAKPGCRGSAPAPARRFALPPHANAEVSPPDPPRRSSMTRGSKRAGTPLLARVHAKQYIVVKERRRDRIQPLLCKRER
jgi:hypothetical protein